MPYFTAAEHETLLTLLKNELLPAVEAGGGDDPAGAHRAFVNGLLPASVAGRRTRIPAFALLRAERDALPRRTAVPHGRTEAGLLHRGLRTHLTKPGFFAILSKKDRRFLYDRFPSRTL